MNPKDHWEAIYTAKAARTVSWFQEHAERSLELIREAAVSHSAAIIDVGGGASTLVDDLLADGYTNISVLDISGAALAAARARLESRAASVHWIEASILDAGLPRQAFDLWHDRAAFHFLTSASDRRTYAQAVTRAVTPDGLVIIATFADDGPARCSGLPVVRYNEHTLNAELGVGFKLLRHERESHRTPTGGEQRFMYCVFRLKATP